MIHALVFLIGSMLSLILLDTNNSVCKKKNRNEIYYLGQEVLEVEFSASKDLLSVLLFKQALGFSFELMNEFLMS